jgi:hypothetical protein
MERVAEAERRDPARVRPVLQALVGEEPWVRAALRPLASQLNVARRAGALEEFVACSLNTETTTRLLGVVTRQAVHRLRERGRLWGRTIGNATWFPAWQFTEAGLRPDLPELLQRLGSFTTDAVAADRVMRLPRRELDGRSIAEALQDGDRRELAWQLLSALGAGG